MNSKSPRSYVEAVAVFENGSTFPVGFERWGLRLLFVGKSNTLRDPPIGGLVFLFVHTHGRIEFGQGRNVDSFFPPWLRTLPSLAVLELLVGLAGLKGPVSDGLAELILLGREVLSLESMGLLMSSGCSLTFSFSRASCLLNLFILTNNYALIIISS